MKPYDPVTETPSPTVPTFRRSLLQASIALLGATALGIAACGGGGGGGGGDDDGGGPGGGGNEQPLDVSQGASTLGRTETLGVALNAPWGLAFLPDGRMLVTEKGGTFALVNAAGTGLTRFAAPVAVTEGSPGGQGGLLDVAVRDGWVYFTYAEGDFGASGTALARAQLNGAGNGMQNLQVLWRQAPKVAGGSHFGARIAFRSDGTLYLAVGERGMEANNGNARADGVQSGSNTIGKVLRLNADGSPADGSALGIWSTGHRNPQGAAVRPGSDELWVTEHGPQGGDELNRVTAGANFGWPVKSYGCNYGEPQGAGCRIGGGTHAPAYAEPKSIWVPTSTAPSGLAFCDGNCAFAEWRGSVLSGALNGTTLWRIVLDGNGNATSRQEIQAAKSLGVRIRDVRQGPDGNIYLLTNGGNAAHANRIVRLVP